MTTQEQINAILDYLENCYAGARMMDDIEIMTRIERAIAVIDTPASEDVFLRKFATKYINRKVAEALRDADNS